MSNTTIEGQAKQIYTPIGESVYSFLVKKSHNRAHMPALSYFGNRITFGRLMENIDRTAAALNKLGISKGDTVIVSLPSVPQAVELFYAINKIGAVFCGMDCRSSRDEIMESISQVKPKACFVSDFHLKAFKGIGDIPIICVSFMKTINLISSFASVFVGIFTGRSMIIASGKNFMSYGRFIAMGKNTSVKKVDVDPQEVCAYFYTSGTTYGRKCAVLTNENINASVLQYALSQEGVEETDRFCTIMPLFTCYGITLGTHLPLILGKQVRMIPLFTGKNMKRLLLSEKPGYISTVPSHWDYFIKDDFANVDLSFFKGAIVGGDKLSISGEEKINSILRSCNSPGKVMRGYGLTEAATAVTASPSDTPAGSVGVSMCWSEIGIFKPHTEERVSRGEKGEICVCGPNVFKGYLNDEAATGELLKCHSDGRVWLHTGDIGYFDDNNFLYFCERIKRIFVRFDGTKISPYFIEQQLHRCPVVEHCLVYGEEDPNHAYGKCPAVLVVFKEAWSSEDAEGIFKQYIRDNLAYHLRPVKISVVNSLPVTKSGKLDYFRASRTIKI